MNNYEKLYQRGIIDENEYKNMQNKKIEKTKDELDLDLMLTNKLEREFKKFKKDLKKLPKNKIIDKAYELTSKEEIKDTLINMDLYDEEKELLFLQDDVLNEFYHDWLDCDVPLGDSMKECVEESVATLSRYFGKRTPYSKER